MAETDKNEILKVLDQFITTTGHVQNDEQYNLTKIISLSKNPKQIRKQIVNDYRLIDGNNKYLEGQLKMLKIDTKEFNEKYGN